MFYKKMHELLTELTKSMEEDSKLFDESEKRSKKAEDQVVDLKKQLSLLEIANQKLCEGVIHSSEAEDGSGYPPTCGLCASSAERPQDIEHDADCPAC